MKARPLAVFLLLALSAFLVVVPEAVHAATALVQTTSASGTGTVATLAFGSGITSGNIVALCLSTASAVTAITYGEHTGQNFTWTEQGRRASTATAAVATARAWASGAYSVRVSWTTSSAWVLNIYEISGGRDNVAIRSATGTGTAVATSALTSDNSALILEIGCVAETTSQTLTQGASFTLDGAGPAGGSEHGAVSGSTTFPMTTTNAGGVTWIDLGMIIYTTSSRALNQFGSGCVASCGTTKAITIGDLAPNSLAVVFFDYQQGTAENAPTIGDTYGLTWQSASACVISGFTCGAGNTAGFSASVFYATASVQHTGSDTITVTAGHSMTQNNMYVETFVGVYITAIGTATGAGTASTAITTSASISGLAPQGVVACATEFSSVQTYTPTAPLGKLVQQTGTLGWAEIGTATSLTSSNCPATAGANTDWAVAGVAFNSEVLTTLTMNPGGSSAAITPSNYFTLSFTQQGSTVSSFRATGTTTVFTADPSTTTTIGATSSASTATHQWAITFSGGSATTTTFNTGTGTTLSQTYTYYEQWKPTCQATPETSALTPTTWDGIYAVNCVGTQLGTAGTTGCTVNTASGGGAVSCAGWFDVSTSFGPPASLGTSWLAIPPISFTSADANTYNVNYEFTTAQGTAPYLWLLLIPVVMLAFLVIRKNL